jgi:hypothetical protein
MRVRTIPFATSRLIRLLAIFIAGVAGIDAVEARASAKAGSAALEATSSDLEQRIETLIDRWFAVLEDPTVEAMALTGLLAAPPFELVLDGEVLLDRNALFAWAGNLHATYSQIEHQLAPIRIQPEGRDRYLVRFEFDRHALDQAGLPHVARREHTWIVQSDANAIPVILKMEERPLLFFPGTGPQIVCY